VRLEAEQLTGAARVEAPASWPFGIELSHSISPAKR